MTYAVCPTSRGLARSVGFAPPFGNERAIRPPVRGPHGRAERRTDCFRSSSDGIRHHVGSDAAIWWSLQREVRASSFVIERAIRPPCVGRRRRAASGRIALSIAVGGCTTAYAVECGQMPRIWWIFSARSARPPSVIERAIRPALRGPGGRAASGRIALSIGVGGARRHTPSRGVRCRASRRYSARGPRVLLL